MIQFRKYIIYTLFSCTILIANSCHEEKKITKISFWHFQSEPKLKRALEPLIREFEKLHNCKVETTELSWGDGKTKLIFAFNSKTQPDVLELGSDWIAQFSSSGVLEEIKDEEISLNKFIESSTGPCIWNKKTYSIPWYVDSRVLFYNIDILNNCLSKESNANLEYKISNWNQILELAREINIKGKNFGFATNGPDPHRLYKKLLIFIWTFGGRIIDENGKCVVNSPNNLNAFELYNNLSKTGILESQKNTDDAFVRGKVGFIISGGWLIEKINKENPNLHYGIVQIPTSSFSQEFGTSFAGGEYLSISKDSKNKNLAKELVKFLTDGAKVKEYCKGDVGTILPADKNYYKDIDLLKKPFMQIFSQQLVYSKMTPIHPKWLEIETKLEKGAEYMLLNKMTPKEALEFVDKEINLTLKGN